VIKKKGKYLLAVLLFLTLVFSMIVFFFIPRAAALSLPHRWNNIPQGLSRTALIRYLGKPAETNSSELEAGGDVWKAERKNGEYILHVQYSINGDTVVKSYALDFMYELGLFHKRYQLRSAAGN
jgi:hypothetical protein